MYYSSNTFKWRVSVISAFFLCAVSLVAFQEVSFAGSFSNIAEEYHRQGYDEQLKGNYHAAATYYYKAAEVDPQNSVYQNDLGLAYEHLDMLDSAERSYLTAIRANPQYLPPYTNLGYFYKKKQDLLKAVYYFEKRIELGDPKDPWTQKARDDLGKVCMSAPYLKERFLRAEKKRLNAQTSRHLQKQFEDQIRLAKAEYRRGRQLLRANKPREALRAFNSSLSFAPGVPKVLRARKIALRESQKEQIAKRADKAMQMLDAGNEKAAKAQFRDVLTINPNQLK